MADIFICPQPFDSWSLNENFDWQAPVPMPSEGSWVWDESTTRWIESSLMI